MRLRLMLSFGLVVLVTVGTFALLWRYTAANEVQAFVVRGGMAGLEGLADDLEAAYRAQGNWDGAESLLAQHGHGKGQNAGGQGVMRQRLILADAAGSVLVDTGGASGGRLSTADLDSAIVLKNDRLVVGYLLPEGGLAVDNANYTTLVNRLTRTALIAAMIAGGMALALALLLAYGVLRPVHELTRAAAELGQGDLGRRVRVKGQDELAQLGSAFNHMAASLQRAEEARQAITADIAHELRNPLAVQRASLEALQDGVYPLTPENLAPSLEQNQLLSRLVDDLRTLALADAGQLKLERVATDFAALSRRIIERFRPQSDARAIALVFETAPRSWSILQLDPMRIEQILSNLLGNALRYTPDGGQITCKLVESPSEALVGISIHDTGGGIPVEALPHIFERFYRADKGRARAEGGSGLGLTIARQLAEAHGGRLTAANHPQGGAVLTLFLPSGER